MANLDSLNEDRVEKALKFLSTTDEEHAAFRAEMDGYEEQLKSVKGSCFLGATGTVAEREASAVSNLTYLKAIDDWVQRVKLFKTIDNKRQTEIRIIEVWQTLSANKRRGNIM